MTDDHPDGFDITLTMQLDHASDVPLYRQIVERIWLGVVEGELETGTRLPTVRQLSIQLGVNPRSVERAYKELETRGVISTTGGSGTHVCLQPSDGTDVRRRDQLVQLCSETASRARSLGFSIDEIADALHELRVTGHGQETGEV